MRNHASPTILPVSLESFVTLNIDACYFKITSIKGLEPLLKGFTYSRTHEFILLSLISHATLLRALARESVDPQWQR